MSWQAAYAGLMPTEFLAGLSIDQRTHGWQTFLEAAEPDRILQVATLADSVVGFAAGGPARDGDATELTAELLAIYLLPSAWGQGLGTALHDAMLRALAESGFAIATLWVLRENRRATDFYIRHGWTFDGAEKSEQLGEVTLDEVRMRRAIVMQ